MAIVWAAVVLLFATSTAPETPRRLKEQQHALMFKDKNHEIPVDASKLKKGDVVQFRDWPRFCELSDRAKSYPRDLALYVLESATIWAFPLIAIYLLGVGVSLNMGTPKKSKAKVICLLVLAFGVVGYSVNVGTRYRAFTNHLSAVRDIHIGDSRDEVKYRLGFPPSVLGSVEQGEFGLQQPVYAVSGADNDVNKMPSTTKVEDYDEWVYEELSSNVRLTVEFNKSGFVESLNLFSNNEKPYGWVGIAGLSSGDFEDRVLRLGQPSRQNLDGVSKTIEYHDIGIVVTLTKGRAYMITIKGPQERAAVFRRFMRSLP